MYIPLCEPFSFSNGQNPNSFQCSIHGREERLLQILGRKNAEMYAELVPACAGEAVLNLVLMNIDLGLLKPEAIYRNLVEDISPNFTKEDIAGAVLQIILSKMPSEDVKCLFKLSVLQSSFSASLAQQVHLQILQALDVFAISTRSSTMNKSH